MSSAPQDLVEHALATSRADQCIVLVHESTHAHLRWAGNTVTTNGVGHRSTATVVSFLEDEHGMRVGSVTGAVTTPAEVAGLAGRADAAAVRVRPAEDAATLEGPRSDPSWDEPPEETDVAVYRELAPALGREFTTWAAREEELYGFVSHETTTSYLGSSTGLRLRHVQPTGHYGVTAKGEQRRRSVWAGGATRDFHDVSVPALAEKLRTRLSWSDRKVDLPAGRYDTILPPEAMADLMITAYWSAGARVAHEGHSAYSRPGGGTRIGDRLAQPGLHLYSDPAHPGLECAPFVMTSQSDTTRSVFDNGRALGRVDWLSDGILTALLQTRHSATLTGQPPTHGTDNLVLSVDGAEGSTGDLVAGTERGLLLTCLWYIREVDPQTLLLTGLTRDGVYLVEDGRIVAEANNFRFNERPLELLQRFSTAGDSRPALSREWGEDYFSRTAMPPLRVPDFHMSSVSEAR